MCEQCGGRIAERVATQRHPYRYTFSGLTNVGLVGITVRRCETCGHERAVIPRMPELHRVIAQMTVSKVGRLSGPEVRFLRKQAGFPANQFAVLLGVSASFISHVENGHKRIGPTADRMVRLVWAAADEGSKVREMLTRWATATLQAKRKTGAQSQSVFVLRPSGWSVGGRHRAA